MAGWETMLAALGGMVFGMGVASLVFRQRDRRGMRQRVELETRLRREIVPVLERRADALGIPPAERGHDGDGPIGLVITLAQAIRTAEESTELPFGDTVEVARKDLAGELKKKARKQA
jgi:hypothetical protein